MLDFNMPPILIGGITYYFISSWEAKFSLPGNVLSLSIFSEKFFSWFLVKKNNANAPKQAKKAPITPVRFKGNSTFAFQKLSKNVKY